MHDIRMMRSGEGIRDSDKRIDDFTRLALLPASPVPERAATDKLGHQILPTLKLARVVNGNDMRMIQRRGQLGFTLEPAPAGEIRGTLREKLDRDFAAEPRVQSTVNLAHAASAYQTFDLIWAQLQSCWQQTVGRLLQFSVWRQIASVLLKAGLLQTIRALPGH